MPQLERIYWLDRKIRAKEYPNARALNEEFGITRTQAYSDYRFLRDRLHAPIEIDKKRKGWYYTDATFTLPALILSQGEIHALRRALLIAREFGDVDSETALKLLADNIGEYAPGVRLDSTEMESVSGAIHPSEMELLDGELITEARNAISNRQKARLRYYSPNTNEETERVIHPYHLRIWRGEVYLIAWCESRQAFRDFLLSRTRIRDWRLVEERHAFTRVSSFEAATYFASGWEARHSESPVCVVIRFSPYQSRWIRERLYHPSQQLEDLPDGGVLLRVWVAGTHEIRRWIMGYGSEAEVLEPVALRQEIKAEIEKLQNLYSSEDL